MIDKHFFKKYNKKLLWFVNTRIGHWFFCVEKELRDKTFTLFEPHCLGWDEGWGWRKVYLKHPKKNGRDYKMKYGYWKTTAFRTRNKYANIINYRLNWLIKIVAWASLVGEAYSIPALQGLPLLGLTTTDFLPQAGHAGGNTTTDQAVSYYDYPNSHTWADIIAQTGNSTDTDLTNTNVDVGATATTDRYYANYRFGMTFNTATIGSGQEISAATMSDYGNSKNNTGLTGTQEKHVAGFTPATNNNFVGADYSQCGGTSFGSVSYASYSTSGYNNITLNASGIANVNMTGISGFSFRNYWDITGTAPGWVSNKYFNMNGNSADTSGTTTDLKLTVTYAASGGSTNTLSSLALMGVGM